MLRNNKFCKFFGIGTIKLKIHDDKKRILKDVRYIPELKMDLISLGMLDKSSCMFVSESRTLLVKNGPVTVMKGFIKNGLYTLKGRTVIGESSITQKTDEYQSMLWYRRLAHVCMKELQELHKQELLGTTNLGELPFYEDCILKKSTRASFKIETHNTK